MTVAVWRPRSVPPVRGTVQRLSDAARTELAGLGELRAVQRHLLRALREPTSFVAAGPLGAGKWTAVALGVSSWPGALWLVGGTDAAAYAREVARRLGAEVTVATVDALPEARPTAVAVCDLHVCDAPEQVLAAITAAYPEVPVIVTTEPDPRAFAWAEQLAQYAGRCGFVDETPYATVRWRLVAPWRDTFAPTDDAGVTEALREVAIRSGVARYWCASKDAALTLATSLLADERVRADDATVHPESGGAASLRLWTDGADTAARDSEVVFVAPVFDPLVLVREAVTTVSDDGRPAGAIVCRDAVDLWLGAAAIACARGGVLTRQGVIERVDAWMSEVVGTPHARAVYALVAGAQVNRGNASSCVLWAESQGLEAARAAVLARIGPGLS